MQFSNCRSRQDLAKRTFTRGCRNAGILQSPVKMSFQSHFISKLVRSACSYFSNLDLRAVLIVELVLLLLFFSCLVSNHSCVDFVVGISTKKKTSGRNDVIRLLT